MFFFQYPLSGSKDCNFFERNTGWRKSSIFQYPLSGSKDCTSQATRRGDTCYTLSVLSKRVEGLQLIVVADGVEELSVPSKRVEGLQPVAEAIRRMDEFTFSTL